MTEFNVPGLYYVAGKNGMHIARTNIEGCTTECGVTLVNGQGLERSVQGRLCAACEHAILHLGTVGGSRQPSKPSESLDDVKAELSRVYQGIRALQARCCGADDLCNGCRALLALLPQRTEIGT